MRQATSSKPRSNLGAFSILSMVVKKSVVGGSDFFSIQETINGGGHETPSRGSRVCEATTGHTPLLATLMTLGLTVEAQTTHSLPA